MVKQMKDGKTISRRNLLKGTALGAAAAGLALAGCSPSSGGAASASGASSANMGEEFDLVIVGAGMGGACAALAASENGTNYVVIEKSGPDGFGGDMSLSGGVLNYQEPDYLFKLLMDYSGQRCDETMARAMADHMKETVDWLIDLGIDVVPSGVTATHSSNGPGLAADLKDALETRNADIRYNTMAVSLIQDEATGKVVGVKAKDKSGNIVDFTANKAVLLTTGSYVANEEMMVKYLGTRDIVARGRQSNTGDGQRMALDVRGKLVFMDSCHGSPIQPESRATFLGWYPFGLIVNRECERFVNEMNPPSDYVVIGQATFRQPGGIAYAILDSKWQEQVPEWNQNYFLNQLGGKLYEADTVEGLAEQFGIDPQGLADAVARYNSAIDETTNTAMTLVPPKTGNAFKLDTPPFVGTPIVNGAAMSFGGVLTNGSAQALDLEGSPIPGLYAAGRVTGGLFADSYVGDEAHGAAVGEAGTFGKLAADAVAKL